MAPDSDDDLPVLGGLYVCENVEDLLVVACLLLRRRDRLRVDEKEISAGREDLVPELLCFRARDGVVDVLNRLVPRELRDLSLDSVGWEGAVNDVSRADRLEEFLVAERRGCDDG